MKITFDWLKDHLSVSAKEEKLLEKLTDIGLEVEGVELSLIHISEPTRRS